MHSYHLFFLLCGEASLRLFACAGVFLVVLVAADMSYLHELGDSPTHVLDKLSGTSSAAHLWQVLVFIYAAGRRRCSSVFAPVPVLGVGVLVPAGVPTQKKCPPFTLSSVVMAGEHILKYMCFL